MPRKRFKRIVLKLSGEALQGEKHFGIDPKVVGFVSEQIAEISFLKIEVAIVIGGGNIFRGLQATDQGIDRSTADYMGMLATVMNALALQDALEKKGVQTRVLSAIEMKALTEPYIRRRAIRHLEKGRVIILACGTGSPYFTTDTAASLRAAEIEADVLIKGTRVDGVYSSDPEKNDEATMYSNLTFMDVLKNDLRVRDASAIWLARENNTTILVFNVLQEGNLKSLIDGE